MERTIELSMWGNIAVEEVIDVRHNGALLKGSFSRCVISPLHYIFFSFSKAYSIFYAFLFVSA